MRTKGWLVAAAAAFGGLCGAADDVRAWGPEGHAVIADIAQAHLSPAALAEVTRLLALESHARLDDVSSWADDVRATTRPETGPWHYVDTPLAEAAYDESRDCHYDNDNNHVDDLTCVVVKLPEFVAILADKSKSDPERLEALKFIVHFVGDIHQPLHAEDKDDKGGNKVSVTYFGTRTNLHSVWDGRIIEKNFGWTLGPNFTFDHAAVADAANTMDQSISAADRAAWSSAKLLDPFSVTVAGWANSSHALAQTAYAKLPPSPRPAHWDDDYQAYAWPVVEVQLETAGVRLAEVLNEALE